jgi:hypothetical protein
VRQLSLSLGGRADEPDGRSAKAGEGAVVRLASESIEAIALRLAELVHDRAASDRWMDANEVADRYGVSRAFVYQHADDLGAIRVGGGSRPRLRFDPATVEERLADVSSTQPRLNGHAAQPPAVTRKRNLAGGADVRLLPIGPKRRTDPSARRDEPPGRGDTSGT